MRHQLWLGIAMALAASAINRTEDVDLKGCANATSITAAVAKVETADLKGISLNQVQAMWPTRLEASDCVVEKCRSASYQGRVIDGHCLCCEKIDIDQSLNSDGGMDKSLVLTIYHTASNEKEAIKLAKALAKAAGLHDNDVSSIGHELDQSFEWEGTRKVEVYLLSVKVEKHETYWTVYFRVDRHLLGSSPSNSG